MFLHVLADFLQITDLLFITADHFPKRFFFFSFFRFILTYRPQCFQFISILSEYQLAEAYKDVICHSEHRLVF